MKQAAGFAIPDGLKIIGRRFLGLTRARAAPRRLQPIGSRGVSLVPPEGSDNEEPRRNAASGSAGFQPFSSTVDTVTVEVAEAEAGKEPALPCAATENCAPVALATFVPVRLPTKPPHSIRPAPTVSHALRDSNRPHINVEVPSAAVQPPMAKPVLQPASAADVLSAPERKKAPVQRKRLREVVLNSSSGESEGESECSSDATERPARTRHKVSARRSGQVSRRPREANEVSHSEPSDSGAAANEAGDSGGSCVESEDAEPAVRSKRATAKRARKSDGKPAVAELRQQ